MADIFDFHIAITARDEATQPINEVVSAVMSLESAISSLNRSLQATAAIAARIGGNLSQGVNVDAPTTTPTAPRPAPARNEQGQFIAPSATLPGKGMAAGFVRGVGLIKDAFGLLSDVTDRLGDLVDEAAVSINNNINKAVAQTSTNAAMAQERLAAYTTQTLRLANASGFSAERIGELAFQLAESSIFLDDEDVRNNADAIIALSQSFEISGDRLAGLIGGLRFAGARFEDVTKAANEFQQQFKVVGLLQQLPEVIGIVDESLAQFGERIVGSGARATQSLLKQTANIARAFNINVQQAVQKASASFTKFTEEIDAVDDVLLGLEGDFGPLTQGLFQLGFSLDETQRLLRTGQQSALDFAIAVREAAAARFGEGTRDFQRQIKLIAKSSDEVTKRLLLEQRVFDSQLQAREEANTASGQALQSFAQVIEQIRGSFGEALTVFQNLIKLGKVIVGTVFGEVLSGSLKDAKSSIMAFNEVLIDLREKAADPSGFFRQELVPTLRMMTSAFLKVAGVASAFVTTLGAFAAVEGTISIITKIGKAVGNSSRIIQAMMKILPKATGLLRIFGVAFSVVARKVLLPIGIILSLKDAIEEGMSAFEKGEGVIMSFGVGLAKFVDSFLMGIPSTILSRFFPAFEQSFTDGFKQVISSIGASFKQDFLGTLQNFLLPFNIINKKAAVLIVDGVKSGIRATVEYLQTSPLAASFSNAINDMLGQGRILWSSWIAFVQNKSDAFLTGTLNMMTMWQAKFAEIIAAAKDKFLEFVEASAQNYANLIKPLIQGSGFIAKALGLESAAEKLKDAETGVNKLLSGLHDMRMASKETDKAVVDAIKSEADLRDAQLKQRQATRNQAVELAKETFNKEKALRQATLQGIIDAEEDARRERERNKRLEQRRLKAIEKETMQERTARLLRGNKQWIEAVKKADMAVAEARADALEGGATRRRADKVAQREAIRQAGRLAELKTRILGQAGPPGTVTTPSEATTAATGAIAPRRPSGPAGSTAAAPMSPQTQTAGVMSSLSEMVSKNTEMLEMMMKNFERFEVRVKVDASRDFVTRVQRENMRRQRGRIGMS